MGAITAGYGAGIGWEMFVIWDLTAKITTKIYPPIINNFTILQQMQQNNIVPRKVSFACVNRNFYQNTTILLHLLHFLKICHRN